MEQLQLQVEARLFDQDEASLTEMIEILGIGDDVAGKTKKKKKKKKKIKVIIKEIDSKLESDEKAASTCLEQLLAYLKGTKEKEQLNESTKEADQKVAATGVKSVKNGTEEEPKKEQVKPGVEEILLHLAKAKATPSLLRRECKRSGQIAVIRAISPHSSLRSYVETLSDLSLAKLRRIIRVH